MSKTKEKAKVIGRPQTTKLVIKKNSLLFISKTPREIVDLLFDQLQPKMRGGVTDDPQIVRKQRVSAYQQVIQYKKQALAEGKKIGFKGRKILGKTRYSWIHAKKEAVTT